MRTYEPWLGKTEAAIVKMLGFFDRPADEGEINALRADPIIPGLTDSLAGLGGREWNRALTKLRKVGLLLAEDDKRLDAHPLVREHFGEQLKQEQPEAWQEGHRRLYDHLKATAKEYPENVEGMGPLYAAVVHGCLAGENQEALDEVHLKRIRRGSEAFSIHKLGAFGSEVAVLSAFFDPPWERLAPGLSEPYQAWVLNSAGFALRALGRLSEAAGLMRLSVEQGIAQKDWKAAAIRASNLSELLQTHGALREALARARESVDLADRSGDAAQRMVNRTTLAAAQHALGLRAEAAASFAEAERMQAEWQPAYPRLYSLQGYQYCDLLLDEGRDAEVRERAAQTLADGEGKDSLLSIALDHLSLGRAHLLGARRGTGGDLAQAQDHLRQAVGGLRRAGGQEFIPLGLLARAELHLHNGDLGGARRDLEEALELSTRCEFRLHEVDACLGMARLGLSERRGGEEKRTEEKRETARAPGTQGSGGERGEEEGQSTSRSQSPLSLLPLAPLAPLAVSSASSSGLTITQVRGYLDRAAALIAQCGYHRRDEALAELREQILRTPSAGEGPAEDGGPGPSPLSPTLAASPPAPQPTQALMTPASPVDLGIVIALPEEFRVLRDLAGGDLVPHPDPDLSAYLFQRGAYRCAVTLTGEMGEAQAVLFTDRLIRALNPAVLVSIGIAGGLNDLLAGDVHVPSQAVQYLQDSKAEATADGGFAIVPGAPAYRPDFALHKELLHFEFRHDDAYQRWVADCAADFASLLPEEGKRAELVASKQVGARVQALVDGHVATGPVVSASGMFNKRIRCHDRQVKSIEMESAAVLLAAQNRSELKRAIVLRAISDFGDEHKKVLDAKGDGVLRRYAMRNAVRLLWAMLEVGAFPRAPR